MDSNNKLNFSASPHSLQFNNRSRSRSSSKTAAGRRRQTTQDRSPVTATGPAMEAISLLNEIKARYDRQVLLLTSLKRAVTKSERVEQADKSRMRIQIESLLIDLNEESFTISDELANAFASSDSRSATAGMMKRAREFEARQGVILAKIRKYIARDPTTRMVRDETAELTQHRSFTSPSRSYAMSRSPPTRLDMAMLDEIGLAGKKAGSRLRSRERRSKSPLVARSESRGARASPDADLGLHVGAKLVKQWARDCLAPSTGEPLGTFGVKGKHALDQSLRQEPSLPPQLIPTRQPRRSSPSPNLPLRNRSNSATQRNRSRNGNLSARQRAGKAKDGSKYTSGNALAPKDRRNNDVHLSRQSLNSKKALNRIYSMKGSKTRLGSARAAPGTNVNSSRSKMNRKKGVIMIPKFRGCGPGGKHGSLMVRTQTDTSTVATPRQTAPAEEPIRTNEYDDTKDILQQIYDRSSFSKKLADLLTDGSPRGDRKQNDTSLSNLTTQPVPSKTLDQRPERLKAPGTMRASQSTSILQIDKKMAELAEMLDLKKNDQDLKDIRHETHHSYARSRESSVKLGDLPLQTAPDQGSKTNLAETQIKKGGGDITSDTLSARQPGAVDAIAAAAAATTEQVKSNPFLPHELRDKQMALMVENVDQMKDSLAGMLEQMKRQESIISELRNEVSELRRENRELRLEAKKRDMSTESRPPSQGPSYTIQKHPTKTAHLDQPPLRLMTRFPEADTSAKKDFMKYSPHRHIQRMRSNSSLRESSFHKDVQLATGSRVRHNLSSHEVFVSRPFASRFGKLWSENESRLAEERRGLAEVNELDLAADGVYHRKLVSELEKLDDKAERHAAFMSPIDAFPPLKESKEPSPTSRFPENNNNNELKRPYIEQLPAQFDETGLSDWALARLKNQQAGVLRVKR